MKALSKNLFLLSLTVIASVCFAERPQNNYISFSASSDLFVRTAVIEFKKHLTDLDTSSIGFTDVNFSYDLQDSGSLIIDDVSIEKFDFNNDYSTSFISNFSSNIFTIKSTSIKKSLNVAVNYRYIPKSGNENKLQANCLFSLKNVIFTKKFDTNQKIVTSFNAEFDNVSCEGQKLGLQLEAALIQAQIKQIKNNLTMFGSLINQLDILLMTSYTRGTGINIPITAYGDHAVNLEIYGDTPLQNSDQYIQIYSGEFKEFSIGDINSTPFIDFNTDESSKQLAIHKNLFLSTYLYAFLFNPDLTIEKGDPSMAKYKFIFNVNFLARYIPDILNKYIGSTEIYIFITKSTFTINQNGNGRAAFSIQFRTRDSNKSLLLEMILSVEIGNIFNQADNLSLNTETGEINAKITLDNFFNYDYDFPGSYNVYKQTELSNIFIGLFKDDFHAPKALVGSLSFQSVFGKFNSLKLSDDKNFIILQLIDKP